MNCLTKIMYSLILLLNVMSVSYIMDILEAARTGNIERVKELIADVNIQNLRYGMTPLYVAVSRGHTTVAKLLIRAGARVNLCNEYGGAPLHCAAGAGNLIVVQLLIEAGADVNLQSLAPGGGWTPLQYAALSGHVTVAQLLIAAGATVDLQTRGAGGWTPLHCAACKGHMAVAQILLKAGANPNFFREGKPLV